MLKILIALADNSESEELKVSLESQFRSVFVSNASAKDLEACFVGEIPDVAFVDARAFEGEARECLTGQAHTTCLIAVLPDFSHHASISHAVEGGACGCLVHPFSAQDAAFVVETAMAQHEILAGLENEVDVLTRKLETRKVLDKAKGILMSHGLTEEEAFKRLRDTAMNRRMSLRDVADAVVLSEQMERL